MTELRVDATTLSVASAAVMRAAAGARLNADLGGPAEDTLGSVAVAHALEFGAHQQSTRADIAADTLAAIGSTPQDTAAAFSHADAALAGAF